MNFCQKTGKVKHRSAHDAMRGANHGHAERCYKCSHCGSWHVTHHKHELRTQSKWARIAFGRAAHA